MKKRAKHPEDMSAAELARFTRPFDEPFVFEKARPMTPAERAQERKLRRRRGRPRHGKGAKKTSVSLARHQLQNALRIRPRPLRQRLAGSAGAMGRP